MRSFCPWPGGPTIDVASLATDGAIRACGVRHLTPAERAGAERFRVAEDRDRFVLGRGLLRERLGEALGIAPEAVPLALDPHGKPVLPEPSGLAFNVSHSGNLVLVAVGRAEAIGIDVERHRAGIDVAALGRVVLAPGELAALAAAGPARTRLFYRSWVLKEALVKALGTGLSHDPRRFEIALRDGAPTPRFVGAGPDDVGTGWRLQELVVPPGYSAAIAVRGEAAPP